MPIVSRFFGIIIRMFFEVSFMSMYWDVIEARVLEHGRFWVKFADGLEGTVRMQPSSFRGVFQRLADPALFQQLYVNHYFVTWPGELDLAPDAMHEQIKESGEWVLS